MTIANAINRNLYGGSPFDGVDVTGYPFDLQGWCDDTEIFDMVIDAVRPPLIVEVGTWKGTSAHYMLKRALTYQDASIICIDTWLGSSEHWLNPEWRAMLDIRGGRPHLQEQFMANVVHAGLQDRVVPLPLPSRLASIVLKAMSFGGMPFNAPMIYVDGAHDEASVREDIAAYWPLVSPGGFLIGDDYSQEWQGVLKAVADFRVEMAGEIEATGNLRHRWFARKKA